MSAAVRKRKPALKTLPTGFREPRGHGDLIGRLFQAAKSGRLPHALLFEGPEGTGKFTAMHWFATGLLCEGGPAAPCGECGPCKRVRTGNHPDLYIVDPIKDEEETLRVTRI
ncbi:MAG: DNA polymerase III gamma/tau subunit, partial [Planctomycetota bacterium]